MSQSNISTKLGCAVAKVYRLKEELAAHPSLENAILVHLAEVEALELAADWGKQGKFEKSVDEVES